MKRLLTLCLLTGLAGCATPYSGNFLTAFTGGFTEGDAPGDLVAISFSGNGFISAETVSAYTMYRSAEYTIEQGGTHFVAYNNLVDAAVNNMADTPHIGTIGGKPNATLYILVLDHSEVGAFVAADVMADYQDIVHPPKVSQTE